MTEAHLWSAIALLGLTGWAVTLIFITKAKLPESSAFANLQRISNIYDDRIARVLDHARALQNKTKEAPKIPQHTSRAASAADEVAALFGGPILDQPDPNVETIRA